MTKHARFTRWDLKNPRNYVQCASITVLFDFYHLSVDTKIRAGQCGSYKTLGAAKAAFTRTFLSGKNIWEQNLCK